MSSKPVETLPPQPWKDVVVAFETVDVWYRVGVPVKVSVRVRGSRLTEPSGYRSCYEAGQDEQRRAVAKLQRVLTQLCQEETDE